MMRKTVVILLLILSAAVLVFAGMCHAASSPYTVFEEVSEETIASFDPSVFFSGKPSGEKARILFSNEEAMLRRLQLAANAEKTLDISTFELKIDSNTLNLMAALMMAARRGVQVRLLIDGAYPFHPKELLFLYAMSLEENLTVKIYNPRSPFHPEKWMPRLHDKVFIMDGTVYIAGGRNTTSYFLTDRKDLRHDWDVLVESSEDASAGRILGYFNAEWDSEDSVTRFDKKIFQPLSQNSGKMLELIWEEGTENHPEWQEMPDDSLFESVNNIIPLHNPLGAKRKEPVLLYQLSELMIQADGDIIAHTPYIVLNDYMGQRLKAITESGKSFTMMTNSPASNDNMICVADYLTNKEDILSTGISIMEFNGGNSYHGKCFTLGDRLSGIGSFNWDIRSAYLDTELMLIIDSPEINRILREEMGYYESQSIPVNPDGTYDLAPGQEAPRLDERKERMMKVLVPFDRKYHHLL